MMTHAVKTWMNFYSDQEKGNKMFELRKDDRPYKVGDFFLSQEFDSKSDTYTGKEETYVISYILRNAEGFGLKEGYCIIQLVPYDRH